MTFRFVRKVLVMCVLVIATLSSAGCGGSLKWDSDDTSWDENDWG